MPKRKSVTLPRLRRDFEDATPERLRHAAERGSARVDGEGVRRLGDPFDTLHSRGLLDRGDPGTNARLWQAGDRLRHHWHGSRLDPLAAFDFRRDAVDGGSAAPGSPTDGAMRHREALRKAQDAIGPRLLPYLVGVVIDARPVAELRNLVTDSGHARTAEALALERLREALHRLADHWRMAARAGTGSRLRSWRDAPDG